MEKKKKEKKNKARDRKARRKIQMTGKKRLKRDMDENVKKRSKVKVKET